MLVTLFNKDAMHKLTLPTTVLGNYWITDKRGKFERKLVNIKSKSNEWIIENDGDIEVFEIDAIDIRNGNLSVKNNSNTIMKKIVLKEQSMYGIYLTRTKQFFIIYCLSNYDEEFIRYDISNTQNILIGKSNANHITYKNKLVADNHAKIVLNNGKLLLENNDSNVGTFVNNNPIGNETRILFNGDVIFIMGLKIIIMGNSLFINKPKDEIEINNSYLSISKNLKETPLLDNDEEDEEDVELYKDSDYYSRAPRISNIIEEEKVKIDAPPQIQEKQETPIFLLLGSTFSMGAMMIVSLVNTIDSNRSGQTDTKQMIFTLITTLLMLVGILLIPIIQVKYEKKEKIKYEKKRQEKYKEYLKQKSSEIEEIKNKQRNILFKNYVSAEECTSIILNRNHRLWERKIEDYDFLSVRLGIGDVPVKINVQYPEKQFSMEEDNLVEILNKIGEESETLKGVPLVTSLVEKNISAFVKEDEETFEKFMQNILVQIVTFQSYEDLKIVFLIDEDKQKKWEYVKMLPHLWNSTHDIRFFADNYDDMKELSEYLEEEYKFRSQSEAESYKQFLPYYLIITDNYNKIENLKIIRDILKNDDNNLGYSLLCITNDINQLPSECKSFIKIEKNNSVIFDNEISSTNFRKITLEVASTFFLGKIWQTIANIPIRSITSGKAALPSHYTFLDMYDVGLIEQLNVLERWRKNDPTMSLKAQIGIDENKMPIVLDIHEKFHGPHGLIAGSTGSGKSEFIITYILSLAINYHPDDVAFLLIDYKGGGLAGAFKKNNVKLPHLVGTITNIDTNELQRSLASIQSEVKRRQIVFNEARNKTDEGTIDIYKYQKLYHAGLVDEPIPHLLIICDEFAELKQQQEEFMEDLISISRIGRSLGVHLILATQKPAGVVNDQIRSNSKFGICLKVQETEDSMDVIKKPDAAYLKRAGQFYMQVGNDDYFILGQSAWTGAPYFPSNTTKRKIDKSIEFISNIGTTIKKIDDAKHQIINNEGEQLTNIVNYVFNLAKREKIVNRSLWLENIPETIYVDDLKKKYNNKKDEKNITALIGEYDDPYNQSQGSVKLNLMDGGNIIVYGNAESGKETLLSTFVYNLITTYTSEQIQLYLLDFGSETLKIFKNSPHVGDIVFINEEEKLGRCFNMIQEEITNRKSLLSDYNGDYKLYVETSGKTLPLLIITINNYEEFNEIYEDIYDDTLLSLTREGIKYGIIFITTTSSINDMRYRLSQNFKRKIVLQLNKDDDYYSIFEKIDKKRPANKFGRGLVEIEKDIFEFQTAKICDATEYNSFVMKTIERLKEENKIYAPNVPTLPDRVRIEDVKKSIKNITAVPLGITRETLKILTYNFKSNFVTLLSSKRIDDCIDYSYYLQEVIKHLKDVNSVIINAERSSVNDNNNFKVTYNELSYRLEKNKNKDIHNIVIIMGIDNFLNSIEDNEFTELLQKARVNENYSFIITDSASKLKEHTYDEWYKEFVQEGNGIWLGNGLDSQYLINVEGDRKQIIDNCGRDFGYVIKDSNAKMMKLLGMKKERDDEIE